MVAGRFGQQLREPCLRAAEPGFHRSQRDPQHAADIGQRQLLEDAKRQHLLVACAKPGERSLDPVGSRFYIKTVENLVARVGYMLCRWHCGHVPAVATFRTGVVAGDVPGGDEQPPDDRPVDDANT